MKNTATATGDIDVVIRGMYFRFHNIQIVWSNRGAHHTGNTCWQQAPLAALFVLCVTLWMIVLIGGANNRNYSIYTFYSGQLVVFVLKKQ